MAPNESDWERAALVCREVAELPDRTSSDLNPDEMIVTSDELAPLIAAVLAEERARWLLPQDIARKALSDAEETAFQAGVEAMRELAGYVAIHACLMPPDGGSPTEDEREMCAEVARQIYAAGMPLKPTGGSRVS